MMEPMIQQPEQISSEASVQVHAFAESRIGGRTENQDSYGWADTKFGYLLTVCDGMGGGPGGKTASSLAVHHIIAGIEEGLDDIPIGNVIIKAVQRANMEILSHAEENPALKGMGSTVTMLLINEKSAWVAHVGDSRVYQLRNGKKVFRTFDHSLVFDLVKKGIITEEQARLSAESNIITRALGIKPTIEVDLIELPYIKGDRFILTSDGIHGSMPERELIKSCSRKIAIESIVDDVATSVDNTGSALDNNHDNLTIAIAETLVSSKLTTKMTSKTKIIICILACICLINISMTIRLFFYDIPEVKNSILTTDSIESLINLKAVEFESDSSHAAGGEGEGSD